MGDSKLMIYDNTVYEISGNLARRDYQNDKKSLWEAAEMKLAFVGRVVTMTNGFFQGYLVNLYSIDTFRPSLRDAEIPIMGRFVKGRNDSVDIVFVSTEGSSYNRFWIKKKVNLGVCGIFTNACSIKDDKDWSRQLYYDGYFNCDAKKAYVSSDDEMEELVSIVRSVYAYHTKTKSAKNAEKAIGDFDCIQDRLLDLLDEHESVSADISYPDVKK